MRFLLGRWPKLSRGWRTAPGQPTTIELRANIYLARDALEDEKRLKVWKNCHGCKRLARETAQAVADIVASAESMIACDWMKWLRSKEAKGAFGVETMANNLGQQRWYDVAYRPQSQIAHARDALAYLYSGQAPMTIDADIGANVDGAVEPLHLANALFVGTARLINWRFGLAMRRQIKGLTDRAMTLIGNV
jgi:hypothetical protein